MSDKDKVLDVQLLDRKFQVKCANDQAEALQHASYYLDSKMREIRDSGKAVGNEKIAVMAALNLAYELSTVQRQKDLYLDTMGRRIRDLQTKIETVLAQHESLSV